MPIQPNQQQDRSEHDGPTSRSITTRPGLALAVAVLILVGAIVALHLTGVLGPTKLH